MRGALREPVENPVAPIRLRPDLRTGYAEEDETSQNPGHCLSRFMASLPRVLLIGGFALFGVTRS